MFAMLTKKTVGLTLETDGGGLAMAGEDNDFVGKGQQFFADGADDLGERATPKVGASDAAAEEGVASDEAISVGRLFTGGDAGWPGKGRS